MNVFVENFHIKPCHHAAYDFLGICRREKAAATKFSVDPIAKVPINVFSESNGKCVDGHT